VTVPASSNNVQFPLNLLAVGSQIGQTLTVVANGTTRSATVTVLPMIASVNLTLNTISHTGGTTTANVSLSAPAPTGGLTIFPREPNARHRDPVANTLTVLAGAVNTSASVTVSAAGSAGNTTKIYAYGMTTLITAGSNGAMLPQAIINVGSTAGFPSTGGTIYVVNNTPATETVTCTGTTGTTFTGCGGGTGTLATNGVVSSEISGKYSTLTLN